MEVCFIKDPVVQYIGNARTTTPSIHFDRYPLINDSSV